MGHAVHQLVEPDTARPTTESIWGRLASANTSEACDRLAARPLAQERSRLFEQQAEAYDSAGRPIPMR